jgi:hypothetical protein
MTDKLDALRAAALKLDEAKDEELRAHKIWTQAKRKCEAAEREYMKALDAIHQPA